MPRKIVTLAPIALLAACSGQYPSKHPARTPTAQYRTGQGPLAVDDHVPDFATRNFEPFTRQDVVAIATREWRLFGQPVDDDDPEQRPEPQTASVKPERTPGLWQRVGEYWWIGQDPGETEVGWTGKHAADGQITDFVHDGFYAWSAAFISYVMRVAGANDRFAYSPNHSTYINAAAAGTESGVRAQDPAVYAPALGDLICVGRGASKRVRFADLPTQYGFPAHCGFVVATGQNGPPFGRQISIIGGNVDDAVTLTHVPVGPDGKLADATGHSYDPRYPWCVVLQVLYDADSEPPDHG
ncbi:DUF2272 domain-containing protein [Gluconacetobacter diazotrophicus]|uniref:DUF2272 domain-containing protein n=1 Tax=Gluconacetobacter diazotrophicus (strain ATCC 49037 / DSM 5601 / CCUG 37298 / CIP 103539 / LMG 7603 / PAl5) TaxID=272568 RepID=A9HAF1_GLUDA|nr:DUF2272 domain-containing protein [Gluconacetobacter diazotrophicus]CAP54682.1 conserved hypothetical protein [Gluconacetobacter diazotrophicus PA1 5]